MTLAYQISGWGLFVILIIGALVGAISALLMRRRDYVLLWAFIIGAAVSATLIFLHS